tara:strand:- start:19172 stop:20785 length:1614 start_codon:yes stop_codon:yes gene_type:complete
MALGVPSESPAIVVKEVDLTGGVPNVQSTTGAIAGKFRWGPAGVAKKISTETELVSTFGAPDDAHSVDFHSAAYFLKYSNALQVIRAVDTSAFNAGSADSAGAADFIRNADHRDGLTGLNTWAAKYPGTLGNSLKYVKINSTGWAGANASFKAQFDAAPSAGEVHVLVLDEDGVISGTANTVLERFPFLSTTSTAQNADGSSNFAPSVINARSDWLWYNDAAFTDSTGTASMAHGTDGSVVAADYQTAYNQIEDKDTIEVDFLIAAGMANATDQETIVDDLAATAGTTRKDCVVVTSPSKASVVNNTDPVAASVTEADTFARSSYVVVDNNHLKIYDKYNDKYIHIPAASSTAGIMAASDNDTAPWFSPAGARRGGYLGVTNLAYTPTKSQRDTLYKAAINPIANLPGQGVLLFGDKTHLARPSAFDRINVRRLFLVLERAIALAARNTMFEFNDEFTRAEFVSIVEPFLREVKGRRGITDFRVVCDETNNTGTVIDNNEFVANIFIKPARSVNYITLNFVAVRTGVDFEEVAGLQV